MADERWSKLKDAFETLVELSRDEQRERVAVLASTDPELSRRLEALLAADASADALLEPLEIFRCAVTEVEAGNDRSSAKAPAGSAVDPFGLSGCSVSHFRVGEVLGCGGMGVVYRAEDVRLGRTVALKFLLPQYSLDAAAKQRFLREARAASALDHPNVCTVHEVGESEQGQLFLAMGCYGGETLRARLAREGPLPVAEALEIARQALLGLGAAHDGGIVHRDLKPANLMCASDGTVKVLDFGLAKVRDLQLTDAERRPGTVAYMSPEQLRGVAVDARTDLWALGVVLYEMLTGRSPFGGGHDLSTVYSILHEEPAPVSSLREEVPEALDQLVGRILRKEPQERFASAAEVLADLQGVLARSAAGEPVRRRSRRAFPGRRSALLALVALLAVAGMGTALVVTGGRTAAESSGALDTRSVVSAVPSSTLEEASIAVLPFLDMSPERDQEYFADGITEDILNILAQVPELRVPARTSSFFFKGRSLPVREIAQRLEVATVLEGSVRRVGNRVRITAQLIDARSDRHLWSHTFDRELEDIFAVQTEIARTVAEALKVRLAVGQNPAGGPPPVSVVAHDLYLRGLFHWNRRSANDLEHAIRFFEEATQVDPGYARALAGLALTYAVLPLFTNSLSTAEAFARAEAAASRALVLDPSLGEAHAARAYAYHWQWRWEDAEREFERAIALSPGNATVRQWYGAHLTTMGRGREGEEELRRAVALDPLSLVAQNDLGIVLMHNRRFTEAIAQLEHTHRSDPGFAIPSYLLQRLYLLTGRTEDAAQAGRRWAELSGTVDPAEVVTLIRATRNDAERPTALAILARWERAQAPRWPDIAFYYVSLNEPEQAIAALEEGLRSRTPLMVQLIRAPWFDPLRSDPRVESILREMNFL